MTHAQKLIAALKTDSYLTRGDLILLLWEGKAQKDADKALHVEVCKARKLLPAGEKIEAIRGKAYKLVAVDVQAV